MPPRRFRPKNKREERVILREAKDLNAINSVFVFRWPVLKLLINKALLRRRSQLCYPSMSSSPLPFRSLARIAPLRRA